MRRNLMISAEKKLLQLWGKRQFIFHLCQIVIDVFLELPTNGEWV